MRLVKTFLLLAALFPLMGCDSLRQNTPAPDLRVKLAPSADGKRMLALPPECASWAQDDSMPFENQPSPRFGCATARNLAAQVERPEDLAQGRPMGENDGTVAAANMALYRQGKTIPLVDPNVRGSAPASGLRKDVE